MNDEEILGKINRLKSRVKEIVQSIQELKKTLERGEISLEDFKINKNALEEELRGILQKISQIKETSQIQQTLKPKEETQLEIPKISHQLRQTEIKHEEERPPEIKVIPKQIITSDIIDKEIQVAREANELMYFFQISFVDSITVADVYLSITLEDHFIFRIDYTNFPSKPTIKIPPTILKLYDNDENKFFDELTTYKYWDPNNPRKIYELVTDIETVLINLFGADLETILEESKKFSEQAKSIEEMVELTETAIINKNYEKATELLYAIIDQAYNLEDYASAKKYTKRLNEVLKKGYKEA
ncbi:MAG: hypothetical protein ACTSR8_05975 [Promethearchaeota archaeon]